MSRTQQTKSSAAWRKAGYTDTERAGSLAQEVADLVPTDVLLDVTGAVADPDQALLAFVRLREALDAPGRRALTEALTQPLARARLFGVLGASSALGDHLVAKPEQWRDVVAAERRDQAAFAQALIAEIDGRDDDVSAYDALRVAYRRQLVQIAALDVTDPEPLPTGHPLWSAPGVIISPHVGGVTQAFRPRAVSMLRRQLTALAAGEPPINLVHEG